VVLLVVLVQLVLLVNQRFLDLQVHRVLQEQAVHRVLMVLVV
jgi:hypothetical protein